jgi:5-formyltetrahydrofolate cyclo-ligase
MIHIEAAKLALRDQLVTARGRLPLSEIGDRARAVAALLLDVPEVRRAATVASYVSVGREPGTGPLLDALTGQGKRVILPLLQPDNDLDWAPYQGPGSLLPASSGLLEPAAPPLGPEAIATADVVIMPGLAVDRTGLRLGRGGGSYDRALGRVPVGTFTCVLLNAAEVLDEVPAAPHDRRVTAAATELGLTRF